MFYMNDNVISSLLLLKAIRCCQALSPAWHPLGSHRSVHQTAARSASYAASYATACASSCAVGETGGGAASMRTL
jgi:hypothetical protein